MPKVTFWGNKTTFISMDNILEFTLDRISAGSALIRSLLYENGLTTTFETLRTDGDYSNINDETLDTIHDLVANYLMDIRDKTHDTNGDVWYEGGDPWIFENGEYCYEYHEIEGWFYYCDPELNTYGLFRPGENFSP